MKRLSFILICMLIPAVGRAAGDPYKRIAKQLVKGLRALDQPRVAALAFPYHNGYENSGSVIVCERLATRLADYRSVRMVERILIENLLEEQKLSETGAIDPTSAKEIGRILSVDVIVTGTLIDFRDGQTEVNARALLAETGEVVAASHGLVDRTWSDPSRPPRPRPRTIVAPPVEKKENEMIEIGVPASRPGYRGRRRY